MTMLLTELLADIDRAWQLDFVRFVETGEASEDFLDYMDSDASCQQAIEKMMAAQAEILTPVVMEIGQPSASKTPETTTVEPIVRAIQDVLTLPEPERGRTLHAAAVDLKRTVRLPGADALSSALEELSAKQPGAAPSPTAGAGEAPVRSASAPKRLGRRV
jgi:hypothetical protein